MSAAHHQNNLYKYILFIYLLVWLIMPTHRRCKGLILHRVTLNNTHTNSLELPWKRDLPISDTYTWQQTTFTRDSHALNGIRTSNPSRRAASDLWQIT